MQKLLRIKDNCIVKAITINFLYLFGCLLFFVPNNHVDDAQQWYYINGAHTGKTDYLLQWGNDLLGKALQLLANISTSIPWYTILEYTASFISLCILTYVLIKNKLGKTGWIFINLILLFFSYEAYIGVVFTKTAGMVCALAFFGLMSKKTGVAGKIICFLLLLYSVFLRNDYLILNMAIWGAYVFIRFCYDLLIEKGKAYRLYFKYCGTRMLMIFCAFLICTVSVKISTIIIGNEYEDYYVRDRARSSVYDYENIYRNYDENTEAYMKLGITKSEVEMWHTNNFDSVYPTNEILQKAFAISASGNEGERLFAKVFNRESIKNFFKEFPLWFMQVDVCYAVLLIIFASFLCIKTKHIRLITSVGFCFALQLLINYYLFIMGRYSRHRIDVPISLLILLGFLYLNEEYWLVKDIKFNPRTALVFSLVLLVIPQNIDDYISTTSSFNTLEMNNKAFYDETYQDQNHVYFQIITSGRIGKPGFYESFTTVSPLESIPPGYYRNIFFSMASPQKLEVWHEYGINDVFMDIVDNDIMYLILQKNSDMLSVTQGYIQDRYGEKVIASLVKSYADKMIYRINSLDYDILSTIDYHNANDDLLNVHVSLRMDDINRLLIQGTVEIEGMNAFAQNIYLDVVDFETDEHCAYHVYQQIEKNSQDKIEATVIGTYSMPNFYDKTDSIYLVVENNGVIQARKLVIKAGELY